SITPRLGVPASSRAPFAVAAPCFIGVWSLGGFYLSLAPTLTGELVHSHNLLWGGLSIYLLFGSGAIASTAGRNQDAQLLMLGGCSGLLSGVAVTILAIATSTAWLLFAGTAIAGIGFGPAFAGAYRTVIASASPDDRAALTASVFTVIYAAFGAPALIAGIAATHYGLRHTAIVYAAAVGALAAGALSIMITRRERTWRRGTPAPGPTVPAPPGPCTIPPAAVETPVDLFVRQPAERGR
ncbi:MAG TPA: hypothetical protein VIH71_09370, partial [Solirubrobacteraceae bacterium]